MKEKAQRQRAEQQVLIPSAVMRKRPEEQEILQEKPSHIPLTF